MNMKESTPPLSRLAAAVKTTRKQMAKSQEEFARILGCTQASVSRYEDGSVAPGVAVLIRLYDLASGDSKESMAAQIRLSVEADAGHPFFLPESSAAAVASIRSLYEQPGEGIPFLFFTRRNHEFGAAVSRILEGKGVIDRSIIEILELWHRHSGDPDARRYFADAAAFLRVQLSRRDA